MGDMGDIFRAWDEYKRQVKVDNLAAATTQFSAWEGAMPDWTRHTEYHWSRPLAGARMDYWPSTGKWRWRGKTYRGTPYDTARFIAKRED